MPGKKKPSKDGNFTYSKNESFENLEAVQKMALDKRGKDDEPAPDISLFLKAEELKGKLCGLYAEKEKPAAPVNIMGNVIIDGKELQLNIGAEAGTLSDEIPRRAQNDEMNNETENTDD